MAGEIVTMVISDEGLDARINQLRYAFIGTGNEGDARTILQDEARRFSKGVMVLAPPPGLGGDAKLLGEKAVATDLMKIFTPVNDDLLNLIGSAHGTRNVDAWFETKAKQPVHIQWDRIDPSGAGMAEFHKANRNKRGRTINLKAKGQKMAGVWYAPYVVSFADFNAYLKRVQRRVGLRKAGWAKSLVSLGGSAQRWISRHLDYAPGRVVNKVSDPTTPGVAMGNSSAGIMNDEPMVKTVFKTRARSVLRRVQFVWSGYNADMIRKAKISRKERKTDSDLEAFARAGIGYE